jgi:hypothetical protein
LAQIRDKTFPGACLKYSQTSHHGKTGISRYTTGFPLVQQNDIGLETLSQQNCTALARSEVAACLRERWVSQRLLWCDFDPVCVPHLFGTWKATPCHNHLMFNLDGNQNPCAEGGEKIQPAYSGEGD